MTSQERSVFITIIRKLKMHDFFYRVETKRFPRKGKMEEKWNLKAQRRASEKRWMSVNTSSHIE